MNLRQKNASLTQTDQGQKRRPTAVKRISASQQIHDSMRDRIISLEFVPGQSLSRAEIADDYRVSQTPVRDAMMKLEEEGLLVIFPQSKTEVSKIDVDHARETQFMRMSLEIEICKTLANAADPSLTAPALSILERQRQALANDDLQRFAECDRAFHRSLFAALGMETLWDMVKNRSGHIDRLRKLNLPDPGKAADILSLHQKILEAIRTGDAAEAEKYTRMHLSGTLSQLSQIMARNPEFF